MTKTRFIFPTHNRVEWLKESIESVLFSKEVEIWVLAQGCTDGTDEYLAGLNDPRVHYFTRKENKRGGYWWLLTQFPDLQGYLVLWSDDDRMLPLGLERKRAILDENPDISMVFSPVRMMDSEGLIGDIGTMGRIKETDVLRGALAFDKLIIKDYIPTPTVLMRLEHFTPLLRILDETKFALCDWQLWLHAAFVGMVGSYLAEPTIAYRVHAKSDTNEFASTGRYIQDHLDVWDYWRKKGYKPTHSEYLHIEKFLVEVCHLCGRSAVEPLQKLYP